MPSFQDLLYCAPDLTVQLILMIVHLVIWHIVFATIPHMAGKWLATKPYKGILAEHMLKVMKEQFDTEWPEEMAFESVCEIAFGTILHHAVCGVFCIPAAIGMPGMSLATKSALACHASLGELGHEVDEVICWIRDSIFNPAEFKLKNPLPLLGALAVHHVMGFMMVIPLNVFYPTNYYYAFGLFQLHFATAISLMVQMYCWSLSLETARDLLKMKIAVTLGVAAGCFGRGLGFLWTGYCMLSTFYVEGATGFLVFGSFSFVTMLIFNVLLLGDSVKEFVKFIPMSFDNHGQIALKKAVADASSHACADICGDAVSNASSLASADAYADASSNASSYIRQLIRQLSRVRLPRRRPLRRLPAAKRAPAPDAPAASFAAPSGATMARGLGWCNDESTWKAGGCGPSLLSKRVVGAHKSLGASAQLG